VITNATMITFVGKLLADTDEAAQGGLNARTKEWNLWFIAVCVEHSVLIGRVLILTVLPATPGWIETAKKQLVWHQDAMKPGREILEGLALHTQYKDKYDVEDHDVHPVRNLIVLPAVTPASRHRASNPASTAADQLPDLIFP
jgi:hypothetical protein